MEPMVVLLVVTAGTAVLRAAVGGATHRQGRLKGQPSPDECIAYGLGNPRGCVCLHRRQLHTTIASHFRHAAPREFAELQETILDPAKQHLLACADSQSDACPK